jgi:hypothetical protein
MYPLPDATGYCHKVWAEELAKAAPSALRVDDGLHRGRPRPPASLRFEADST